MKDKITISYILVTIALFAITLVYFANLDFKEMNSNIESGGKNVYKQGKHYSDKLYTMVSKKWEVINEDNSSDVIQPVIKKQNKLVFGSTKIKPSKDIKIKPLEVKVKKLAKPIVSKDVNRTVTITTTKLNFKKETK